MKLSAELLRQVALYVEQFIQENLSADFAFHNLQHTRNVVKASDIISTGMGLKNKEKMLLHLAAWFHDTGYAKSSVEHEEESVKIAADFLRSLKVEEDIINSVAELILATKYPQQPLNEMAQVLCDADLLHLSDSNYIEKAEILRYEWKTLKEKEYTDDEWIQINIDFLTNHRYYTSFCRENFEKAKRKNIKRLVALREQMTSIAENPTLAVLTENKDEFEDIKPDRSIDTLLKTVTQNHMRLSDMADKKSNMLISVNSLVASVLISGFIIKNDLHNNLIVPVMVILIVNAITITLAILATRPKMGASGNVKQQSENKDTNLLFFGNFNRIPFSEYKNEMHRIFLDKSLTYDSLLQDVYLLGKVMAKKYRLLTIAYNVFMIGLIVAILVFILTYSINSLIP